MKYSAMKNGKSIIIDDFITLKSILTFFKFEFKFSGIVHFT